MDKQKKRSLTAPDKPLPADPSPASQPLKELILELISPNLQERDGVRRATARARLLFEPDVPVDPANPDEPEISSTESWPFIAPLGPIELDDLRWYLEDYAQWPGGVAVIRDRAQRVQENLPEWGRRLYRAAFPIDHAANVLSAWDGIGSGSTSGAGRRFSVLVDVTLAPGAPETQVIAARKAATLLLGLPWELLHDGTSYLFQGEKPICIRRRLANTRNPAPHTTNSSLPRAAHRRTSPCAAPPPIHPPIRILLITARPEDQSCAYIDHRASALPLAAAMETLPELVEIKILHPPTFPALEEELERARQESEPYHVVHFDGHGNHDPRRGGGILCFENPKDAGKLHHRRHEPIPAHWVGWLLEDHHIPLAFLDACRGAKADPANDRATESVASELLEAGVGSVVAMSHSVLVETARRFVTAFYKALAAGARVGDAMLAGQWQLDKDKSRGRIFGADELLLHDWFVPVLFQQREDPRLFTDISTNIPSRNQKGSEEFRSSVQDAGDGGMPENSASCAAPPSGAPGAGHISSDTGPAGSATLRSGISYTRPEIPVPQTTADAETARKKRLGDLPSEPETGFVGRSRELLALERLLSTPLGAPLSRAASKASKQRAALEGSGPGYGDSPASLRYAVILGQGGEGKTALALEFARWQIRSQQVQRVAFVCVEGIERNLVESVLDRLGHQLIQSGFSTQADCGGDMEQATQKIEGALRGKTTLLVLDNLESILLPPYLAGDTEHATISGALAEEAEDELRSLLALCQRLLDTGGTRILFTSREKLPAPFDGKQNRQELHRLATGDAVRLVESLLAAGDLAGATDRTATDRERETTAGAQTAIDQARGPLPRNETQSPEALGPLPGNGMQSQKPWGNCPERDAIARPQEATSGRVGAIALARKAIARTWGAIARRKNAIAQPRETIAGRKGVTTQGHGAIAPAQEAITPREGAIAPYHEAIAPGRGAIAQCHGAISPEQGEIAQTHGSIAQEREAIAPEEGAGAGNGWREAIATREEIEQLVEAVHGHARTLSLLAPEIRARGVAATRESLTELMVEMEKKFPGHREKSLFASVELSLRRMSPENQERARVLGLFHGGVNLDVLGEMMEWQKDDVDILAADLLVTGLATLNPYNHLTLHPALCPYLRVAGSAGFQPASSEKSVGAHQGAYPPDDLRDAQDAGLADRWGVAMAQYVDFLVQQRDQNTEMAATLTLLELPNLFALLEQVQAAGRGHEQGPVATITLTTKLYRLLQNIGRPRLLERVGAIRDAAAQALGDGWNHAAFDAARTRIEQQLAGGQLREALAGAEALLVRARAVGQKTNQPAYPNADYDLAMACWLLARVLQTTSEAEQVLPLLEEAQQRFEAIAKKRDDKDAAKKVAKRMAAVCLADQGRGLLALGQPDKAATAYEGAIRRHEARGDRRAAAVGESNLGNVRLDQRRYPEALAAFEAARERFAGLGETGNVATAWNQTGMVYQKMGQPEAVGAAEAAYREALAIHTRLGDAARQADTLFQLGILYDIALDRSEAAAGFFRQAVEKHMEIGNVAGEGRDRNSLAEVLRKLGRLDEARLEAHRALECYAPFGHATEPWKTWGIFAEIERNAGAPAAEAAARAEALELYLAYRRDGGENHFLDGRVALAVSQTLASGETDAATALLQEQLPRFEATGFGGFIRALQQILAGNRDPALADTPGLHYTMAAEIRLLLERE
uniref:Tetratricopeptide repeat-containing protein n=1 Tax=Candidatus Kentrum sp. LFY TaxID=2126342 RepID=A0A450WKD6_9GAMM|nr:MAG: Tetratricopeptide repeat-containing protein [Candidatus Kentron sp. LFY]